MLPCDLDLPVGPAHDDRGVIGVDQARLGMQVLDRLVIGVRVGGAVVHPDVGHERVNCHRHPWVWSLPGFSARSARRRTSRSWTWPCTLYQAVIRRSGRAWLSLVTLPSAYAPMTPVMTDAWKRRSCRTMCVSTATQVPYLTMRSGRLARAGPGSARPGTVSAVLSGPVMMLPSLVRGFLCSNHDP